MSRQLSMVAEPESIWTIAQDEFVLDIRSDTTLLAANFRALGCGVRQDLSRLDVLYITPAFNKDLVHLA